MADFEQARLAAEAAFNEANEHGEETLEKESEEVAENENNEAQKVAEDAANTAEVALQAAQDKNMQVQELEAQLSAEREQVGQLQAMVAELSRKREEKVVEEVLAPPVLDLEKLTFADEETAANIQAEYARKMGEYQRAILMEELSPFVKQAKESQLEKEKAEAVEFLSQVPELEGIKEIMPQIEQIIRNNKALQSEDISLDEKLITAYAIARGVNAANTPLPEPPKETTIEEMMEFYNNNEEFRDMVEKQRIEKLKDSQQVPNFSASSGAGNAALNIKERPKTFEEASERTRKMFGLK